MDKRPRWSEGRGSTRDDSKPSAPRRELFPLAETSRAHRSPSPKRSQKPKSRSTLTGDREPREKPTSSRVEQVRSNNRSPIRGRPREDTSDQPPSQLEPRDRRRKDPSLAHKRPTQENQDRRRISPNQGRKSRSPGRSLRDRITAENHSSTRVTQNRQIRLSKSPVGASRYHREPYPVIKPTNSGDTPRHRTRRRRSPSPDPRFRSNRRSRSPPNQARPNQHRILRHDSRSPLTSDRYPEQPVSSRVPEPRKRSRDHYNGRREHSKRGYQRRSPTRRRSASAPRYPNKRLGPGKARPRSRDRQFRPGRLSDQASARPSRQPSPSWEQKVAADREFSPRRADQSGRNHPRRRPSVEMNHPFQHMPAAGHGYPPYQGNMQQPLPAYPNHAAARGRPPRISTGQPWGYSPAPMTPHSAYSNHSQQLHQMSPLQGSPYAHGRGWGPSPMQSGHGYVTNK